MWYSFYILIYNIQNFHHIYNIHDIQFISSQCQSKSIHLFYLLFFYLSFLGLGSSLLLVLPLSFFFLLLFSLGSPSNFFGIPFQSDSTSVYTELLSHVTISSSPRYYIIISPIVDKSGIWNILWCSKLTGSTDFLSLNLMSDIVNFTQFPTWSISIITGIRTGNYMKITVGWKYIKQWELCAAPFGELHKTTPSLEEFCVAQIIYSQKLHTPNCPHRITACSPLIAACSPFRGNLHCACSPPKGAVCMPHIILRGAFCSYLNPLRWAACSPSKVQLLHYLSRELHTIPLGCRPSGELHTNPTTIKGLHAAILVCSSFRDFCKTLLGCSTSEELCTVSRAP